METNIKTLDDLILNKFNEEQQKIFFISNFIPNIKNIQETMINEFGNFYELYLELYKQSTDQDIKNILDKLAINMNFEIPMNNINKLKLKDEDKQTLCNIIKNFINKIKNIFLKYIKYKQKYLQLQQIKNKMN